MVVVTVKNAELEIKINRKVENQLGVIVFH